jgi:hypothetical protein
MTTDYVKGARMETKNSLIFTIIMILTIVLAAIPMGSGDNSEDQIIPPTRNGPITFTNVSKDVGLSHINGNFFSWGDFDNDDHQDLLVNGKRLFRNSGPPEYVFTDVTSHAGIDRPVNSGVFGDYDNDGWMDIFCGGGYGSRDHPETPDILWRNDRDGTFTDVTDLVGGISDTFPSVAGGWSDVDRDGSLDLYIVNYENGTYQGYPDHFWYNNGDGTFRNATTTSGMNEYDRPLQGRGISFTDFDNDGFIDAYVSNYRITPNYLYHNQKNGTMQEAAEQFGVEGHGNDHPVTQDGPYYGHSLGSSWGDLDNDGDMDLWVTNLAHKDAWRGPICDDSYLFENQGPEHGFQFVDVRENSGIPIKDIPGGILGDGDELMVSSALADYDNDGDLDLFLPQIYSDVSYAYSYLYSNEGEITFTDASGDSGVRVWNTYGSAWCDYNEDGWIDLVTGGGNWDGDVGRVVNSAIHLYQNDGASIEPGRKWLEVDLKGRESNNAAVGTRVVVQVDTSGDGVYDLSMMREVNGGTASCGQQDSMILHFGLGDIVHDVRITTKWPMGREIVMEDIEPNTVITNFEPTEPIILNMTITNLEMDPQGTTIALKVENPTIFPIVYTEFGLKIEERDAVTERIILHSNRIDPGINDVTLRTAGMPDDTIANITLTIDRSFPPLISPPIIDYFHDPLTNIMPVAKLEGPSEVAVGEDFILSGTDSHDLDGNVVSYNFDMGDGTISGWQGSGEFSYHYNQPGIYSAHLSVMDDKSGISIEDAVLIIEASGSQDTAPLALIDYIKPDLVELGERVRLNGHGVPYEGRTITGYEWSSSIDGRIGDTSYVAIESLSPGIHMISFKVVDSEDEWSLPSEGSVEVIEQVIEELWITIDQPNVEGSFSGTVQFTGSSGPFERVEYVEIRIDSGPWNRARTVPEWSYEVDCSDLDPGTHRIDARCFGDRYYSNTYATLEFEVAGEEEEGQVEASRESGNEGLMDILKDPTVLIIGSLFGLGSLIMVLVLILLAASRKRRIRKWTADSTGFENRPEDPEVLLPEQDDKDVQVIEATVIE